MTNGEVGADAAEQGDAADEARPDRSLAADLQCSADSGESVSEKRPIDISYRPTLQDVLHAARLAEGETWKTSSRVAAILLATAAAWLFYWGMRAWAILFMSLGVAEWFNLLPLSLVAAYVEYRRNPKYRQEYHLTLSEEHLRCKRSTDDVEQAG